MNGHAPVFILCGLFVVIGLLAPRGEHHPRDPYDIGLPPGNPAPMAVRVLLRDELDHDEDSIFNGRRPSPGVSFTAGVVGRGAWIDGGDRLA